MICLVGLSLAACGNNKQSKEDASLRAENSSLKAKKQKKDVSSLKAENSSLKNAQSSSKNESSSSSNSNVINSPQAASNLVAHAMHTLPAVYTVTSNEDGYIVNRTDDVPLSAFVHHDGSITWNNGTTQSYGEVSAPTAE